MADPARPAKACGTKCRRPLTKGWQGVDVCSHRPDGGQWTRERARSITGGDARSTPHRLGEGVGDLLSRPEPWGRRMGSWGVLSERPSIFQFVRNSIIISDMKTMINTAAQIRKRIEAMPEGEPFTPAAFLECGTRASVDQTLSRLVKAGVIERVTRGVFVRPEVSRFVGKVMPEPLKVAETVARATGAVVQVDGAEAARRLELSTQVPAQAVFVTSGPSKRIRVGNMEIRLQHVCQRKLALSDRPAGLALRAMWYLGKEAVTPALVEKIRLKLGTTEFEVLKSATGSMPAWMSDAIFRNERMAAHV